MAVKFFITLSREAALVLNEMASKEHREPRQQASWLIEAELQRRGLLPQPNQPNKTPQPAEAKHANR